MSHSLLSILLLIAVVFSTCQKEELDADKTPLLEVNGHVLYRENLPQTSLVSQTRADSANLVDSYIKRWVIDAMMYDYAKKNVQNPHEIERLVEEYRKTLIIQHYQQMLVNQRLEPPTEEQIKAYYDTHSTMFVLEDNIIKGVFVKIPAKTSKMRDLRKLMNEINDENLEKMEKFCVRNYGTLDYFQDQWIPLADVLKKMPDASLSEKAAIAASADVIEREDSVFTYLLRITEYRQTGTEAPYDFADGKIKNILLNQKKMEFMHAFEEDLYKDALKDINYFDAPEEGEILNLKNE